MLSSIIVTFLASTIVAIDIPIANPPPAQIDDPEWTALPDELGRPHSVHTFSAMSEPTPPFNARIGVLFELYTPELPNGTQLLRIGDIGRLNATEFRPDRPTRIGIHGWNTSGNLPVMFRQAYFSVGRQNVNFIAVNWQAGSNTISYIAARRHVSAVGQQVADLIDFLVAEAGAKSADFLLFGHSLGAHVAGIAGKRVRSGQLAKIVALDPAYPLFALNRPADRVARGDARTVELIHTAAGMLAFSAPLGDVSFYANGGALQPGCDGDIVSVDSCSHLRAVEIYAESIGTERGFYGVGCGAFEELLEGKCRVPGGGQLVRMGSDPGSQETATGVFFLMTNGEAPFAQGPMDISKTIKQP